MVHARWRATAISVATNCHFVIELLAARLPVGRTGFAVSRIGLGAAGIGSAHIRDDRAAVDRMVGTYLDHGGNLFDTADSYNGGWSEAVVGRVLRSRRDAAVIASKVGFPVGPNADDSGLSARHVVRSLEGSLRRLGTDHVDLYFLHFYDRTVPLAETMAALDGLVRAGKVRAIGASSFHAWQLAEAAAIAEDLGMDGFAAMEVKYSLAVRDVEAELLPYCAQTGVAVLAYSPLQGGLLTGIVRSGQDQVTPPGSRFADPWLRRVYLGPDEARSFALVDELVRVADELGAMPSQVALAWVLARPGVTAALIGPESLDQVEENLGGAALVLTDDVVAQLDAASRTRLPYPADLYEELDGTFEAMRARALESGSIPYGPQAEPTAAS
jgi:aryl-alcohol dehydrogenase-like predicted oxidoreductase